jgi:hypothetical protein
VLDSPSPGYHQWTALAAAVAWCSYYYCRKLPIRDGVCPLEFRDREGRMMKIGLIALGTVAWIGVGVLAIGMAIWDEPVWGFFPIAIAVVVAWSVGEYLTDVYLTREN